MIEEKRTAVSRFVMRERTNVYWPKKSGAKLHTEVSSKGYTLACVMEKHMKEGDGLEKYQLLALLRQEMKAKALLRHPMEEKTASAGPRINELTGRAAGWSNSFLETGLKALTNKNLVTIKDKIITKNFTISELPETLLELEGMDWDDIKWE